MDKTGIIWTEKTWNPVSGCEKVSEGCKFCYAETIAEQYGGKAFPNGFGLTIRPHKLKEPYRWKEPTLCFVNSMSDFFWDKIPDEYRLEILKVIRETPQHEYQVLTKRPEKLLKFSHEHELPPNFWAGVTIENGRFLERAELLRKTKAHIKFISAEPIIGSLKGLDLTGIDWVITGGESGRHLWEEKWQKKRGLVLYNRAEKKWEVKQEAEQWMNEILTEARRAGTHFFHKQWGGNYPEAAGRELNGKTYNEIPVLPGGKTEINNDYLKKIESLRKSA